MVTRLGFSGSRRAVPVARIPAQFRARVMLFLLSNKVDPSRTLDWPLTPIVRPDQSSHAHTESEGD